MALALAGAEGRLASGERLHWRSHAQPLRHVRKPRFDQIGSPLLIELCDDGRRDDHAPVEGWQYVDVFDQNEVAKGACVNDDNHSGGRSRSVASCS